MIRGEIGLNDLRTSSPELKYALRLQMCVEMMRTSFRLYDRAAKDAADVAHNDRVVLMVCMMGWAGEGLRLVEAGVKQGRVRKDMLSSTPQHLAAFEKSQDRADPIFERLHRARDKYFAHWDADVVSCYLKSAAIETSDRVIVQSEDGKFKNTRSPLIFEIIAFDVTGRTDDANEAKNTLLSISKTVASLAGMMDELVLRVLEVGGIKLISRKDEQEG